MISFLSIIFLLAGCFTMFDHKETLMGQFRLKDNATIIKVIDAGSGATSPDVIWIYKNNEKKDRLIIDSIQRGGRIYEVSFEQLNDTILNVTLTDTALFKGDKFKRQVNLNRILKVVSEY